MKTIEITRICNTIVQRWVGDDDNEEMEEQEVLLKKGEVLKRLPWHEQACFQGKLLFPYLWYFRGRFRGGDHKHSYALL